VPFVDVSAVVAFPRRVTWVDHRDRHAGDGRLVADELAELGERPRVQVAALSLVNRDPVADTAQILELDPATGAFGCCDELLADAVVHVPGEPGLAPPAFLEQPL